MSFMFIYEINKFEWFSHERDTGARKSSSEYIFSYKIFKDCSTVSIRKNICNTCSSDNSAATKLAKQILKIQNL